jgi:hypothetical protein
MKVYPVTSYLFDVFFGDGWENWSRWTRSKSGFITMVGGKNPPAIIKAAIINSVKGE